MRSIFVIYIVKSQITSDTLVLCMTLSQRIIETHVAIGCPRSKVAIMATSGCVVRGSRQPHVQIEWLQDGWILGEAIFFQVLGKETASRTSKATTGRSGMETPS
jgi:hypothetical protein